MSVSNLEERIAQAELVLTKVAGGDFNQKIIMGEVDDAFASLEVGINFMIIDLRAMAEMNRKRELELEAQSLELRNKLLKIEQQEAAIRELSTPVMEVWQDVLLLPIVGVLDTKRSLEVMQTLLDRVVQTQSQNVILDITGVEVVDTKTADYLLKVVRAARLLGAHCVMTGLSPAVAQTLVEIGADLSEVLTLRNLREGLRHCLLRLAASGARAQATAAASPQAAPVPVPMPVPMRALVP